MLYHFFIFLQKSLGHKTGLQSLKNWNIMMVFQIGFARKTKEGGVHGNADDGSEHADGSRRRDCRIQNGICVGGGVKSGYNFSAIPVISENLSKNCLKTIPNQKPIRTGAIAACGRKTVLQNRSVFLRAKIWIAERFSWKKIREERRL